MSRLFCASLLLLAGCVTLTEEGKRVASVSKEKRPLLTEKCKLVGDETITNIEGNSSGLTYFEAEREFRNRAAAKGATHIYWEHLPRLNGVIFKSYSYQCPRDVKDLSTPTSAASPNTGEN